jgi:hypothetical protein
VQDLEIQDETTKQGLLHKPKPHASFSSNDSVQVAGLRKQVEELQEMHKQLEDRNHKLRGEISRQGERYRRTVAMSDEQMYAALHASSETPPPSVVPAEAASAAALPTAAVTNKSKQARSDTKEVTKARGAYLCRKCGKPKLNHTCAVKLPTDEVYLLRQIKTSNKDIDIPTNKQVSVVLKIGGVVVGKECPATMSISPNKGKRSHALQRAGASEKQCTHEAERDRKDVLQAPIQLNKRQRKGRHLFDPDLDPRISQHVANALHDNGAISIEATVETRNNSVSSAAKAVASSTKVEKYSGALELRKERWGRMVVEGADDPTSTEGGVECPTCIPGSRKEVGHRGRHLERDQGGIECFKCIAGSGNETGNRGHHLHQVPIRYHVCVHLYIYIYKYIYI